MGIKVCFIVSDAISFNVLNRGQLEYLAEHGCQFTLICGGRRDEVEKLRARNVGRVNHIRMVRDPRPLVDGIALLRLLLHFSFNRYDLVVASTPKALLLGSIAAFFTLQPRRVAFFRGRVYENFKGLRRKFYLLLDQLSIACSHEILFVSRSLLTEYIREIPGAKRKGRVLGNGSGNGVCTQTFSPKNVSSSRIFSLRTELGIADGEFVVLVLGRICRDKGLAEIAEVVHSIAGLDQGVKFVVVGRVEGAEASAKLNCLKATGSVIHVDFTLDVVSYLAIADVHLFLSHREGFGNVAIEAAAMGVPTIAFDVVGVRDSVADGTSGLRFSFGDTKSVINAIQELRNNQDFISQRFPEARRWAVENFSKENVWRIYAEFYLDRRAGY